MKRNPSILSRAAALVMAGTLALAAGGCGLWTVVKNDPAAGGADGTAFYFDDASFDAAGYVASIWTDKVVATADEKGGAVADVLAAAKAGLDDAGAKYGSRSSESGSPWNFIVKGRIRVLAVHTESRNGTADIDVEPFDGTADATLQIGPVFKGTSIRDALPFIKFDDYKNQMVFASLASAFNQHVRDNVMNNVDAASLAGKDMDLLATFTGDASGTVVLTPIRLAAAEGGG